jgi:hypothetical protein
VQLRVQQLLSKPEEKGIRAFSSFFFTLNLPNHEAMDVSVSKATSTLTSTQRASCENSFEHKPTNNQLITEAQTS